MKHGEYAVMASQEDTHWWYRGLRTLVVDHLDHFGIGAEGQRILDVGCGTGGTYQVVHRRFPKVDYVGLDVESQAIEFSRQRGLKSLMQASANEMPLQSASADVILCLDVLYYASIDLDAVLQQFYKVLKPGGILVVNLPAFDILRGRHDVAVGIPKRFRRGKTCARLRKAGFLQTTATYWNMVLFLPLLIWRWISRSTKSSEAKSDVGRLPTWINAVLSKVVQIEVAVSRWLPLPIGSSVFLVAHKSR